MNIDATLAAARAALEDQAIQAAADLIAAERDKRVAAEARVKELEAALANARDAQDVAERRAVVAEERIEFAREVKAERDEKVTLQALLRDLAAKLAAAEARESAAEQRRHDAEERAEALAEAASEKEDDNEVAAIRGDIKDMGSRVIVAVRALEQRGPAPTVAPLAYEMDHQRNAQGLIIKTILKPR